MAYVKRFKHHIAITCVILALGNLIVCLEDSKFANCTEKKAKRLESSYQGGYEHTRTTKQPIGKENKRLDEYSAKVEQSICPEPLFCKCSKSKITCGQNITYIPRVPPDVTNVIMYKALLINVTKATFKNLINVRLDELTISSSGSKSITVDAFSGIIFNYGGTLDLSGNVVAPNQLRDAFCHMHKSRVNISALILDGMGFNQYVPTDLFRCFNDSHLLTLSLKNNGMKAFSGLILAPLGNMTKLNLTYNNLSAIEHPRGLQKLTYLALSHNNFTRMPNFGVDSNGTRITQRLQTVRLSYNSIHSIEQSDFKGLTNLQYLHLKFNAIRVLPGNLLAEMPILTHIFFKCNRLRTISGTAFNSSTLTYIDLSNNVYHFRKADTKNLFKLAPGLQTLYLTDNYLDIDDKRITQLFSPLKNLTRLIIENNRISKVIPPTLLNALPALQELILSSNTIETWNSSMFRQTKTLSKLFLDDNAIIIVTESSFPKDFLLQLKEVNLANNPFACTCDLRWFLHWINTTNAKVINYPHQYKCKSPQHWSDKRLSHFNPTPEYCASKEINLRLILGSVLGSVALIASISTVIIIKYRWHIRYCCYVARSRLKRRGYVEIPDGVNYSYDAFVIYSSADEDRKWVLYTLRPRMENEGFKLCLYDLDFIPGHDIVDNIMESMEASRKVMVILSDKFAESEWCQWELAMAQHKLLDDRREVLVLVKLNDIQPKNMRKRLLVLMREKIYIDWSNQQLGQNMFWQKLCNSLAVLSEPIDA